MSKLHELKEVLNEVERGLYKTALDLAHTYAETHSQCRKVAVGALIVCDGFYVYGANITLPVSCKEAGCRRVELYGEDSKNHRLPEDCRSVHSEIDVITSCAKQGISTEGKMMFVTRYPCEACARAIVRAGIKRVIYGRQQEISQETKNIFNQGGVTVIWVSEWTKEDTTR